MRLNENERYVIYSNIGEVPPEDLKVGELANWLVENNYTTDVIDILASMFEEGIGYVDRPWSLREVEKLQYYGYDVKLGDTVSETVEHVSREYTAQAFENFKSFVCGMSDLIII